MPSAETNGTVLEYASDGPLDGPVMLLIAGLGNQLTSWSPDFVQQLTFAGFRVIRMDHRDTGLSTHFDDAPVPVLAAVTRSVALGLDPEIPYTLSDMANDVIAVMDAVGAATFHVVGVSLGGMITQVLLTEHTSRVASATIIMARSGDSNFPSSDSGVALLTEPVPDPKFEREAFIEHEIAKRRALGSPAYPTCDNDLRQAVAAALDRAYNPDGNARQLAASRAAPDFRGRLRTIDVPILIIHGKDDLLVPWQNGQDLAETLVRAWFLRINGMGHNLPEQLTNLFVANIISNCRR